MQFKTPRDMYSEIAALEAKGEIKPSKTRVFMLELAERRSEFIDILGNLVANKDIPLREFEQAVGEIGEKDAKIHSFNAFIDELTNLRKGIENNDVRYVGATMHMRTYDRRAKKDSGISIECIIPGMGVSVLDSFAFLLHER